MPIDPAEVRRVARLARLRIEADELEALAGDLERVVHYIDSLADVALPGDAEALTYFASDVTRDDHAGPCLDHEEALGNAPERDDDYFLVPKIVDTDKDEA